MSIDRWILDHVSGEHSSSGGSLEFGASTSRSVDETSSPGEVRTSESTLTRTASGPPPLQPVTTHHLPGKSKSLDHIHDRDVVTLDSELVILPDKLKVIVNLPWRVY